MLVTQRVSDSMRQLETEFDCDDKQFGSFQASVYPEQVVEGPTPVK